MMMYLGMYSNCWEKMPQTNGIADEQQSITGEWPRDFIEVIMIALKKKPKATKCSIIAITTKIVARILR
jgi:hypothetical protein